MAAAAIVLIALASRCTCISAFPSRQRREGPLSRVELDVRRLLLEVPGDSEEKAEMIKSVLTEKYEMFLWYIFVFPDNSPDDTLTTPGEELGTAKAWALVQCGTIAKRVARWEGDPFFDAAIMYQLRSELWPVGDLIVLREYRDRCRRWLHGCAERCMTPPDPLDLSCVAACMINHGSIPHISEAMHGLRAVVVLRCVSYAMRLDGGIMMPGSPFPLRGPDSRPEEKIEAIVLPPLPPWE